MGRTSLFMIIVFNMTFMFIGFQLSTIASTAYEKYCGYADIEQAGLALESAANIAISNALLTAPVSADTVLANNASFGKASFTIKRRPMYTAYGNRDGDSLIVIGSYPLTGVLLSSITCTTGVRVRGNAFSQYVFYSESELIGGSPIYWTTGDTCRGRLHTQDNLYTNGKADFKGKVTTKGNVTSSGTPPVFEQGHTKADISIPQSLNDLTTLGTGGGSTAVYSGLNTYVEFLPDGKVIVRTGTNGWTETSTAMNASPNSTIPKCKIYPNIAALTTSGVLLVKDAELHIKGVLNGQITLGAVETSGAGTSSVWIDSSITYHQPPPSTRVPGNSSTDMLGIVSTNDIMVSQYINHTAAKGELTNVNIHASMFSQLGGFGAENYSGRPTDGKLAIVGGIQQHVRRPVGQGTHGFLKDYDFDTNLLTRDPAGYPKTPFVVQNWVDYTSIPKEFFY